MHNNLSILHVVLLVFNKVALLRNIFFIGLLIFGFGNVNLAAQAERYTEEEIMLQDKFIAAHAEKMLGKIDKAITLLKEVHKADRQNATVAFELARAYEIKEDNESTKKYIELACKNDKGNLYFQQFRAEFYEKTNDTEGTLNALDKLMTLEPFNESNFYKAGELYEQNGNSDQAFATYNRLESIIGINEETRRRKFELYNRLGEKKKAIAELVGLSNTYPSNTRYLNNLASYYKEIGDNKLSKKTYTKVLSIDPENPDATIALAGDITEPGNEAAYLIAIKGLIVSPDLDIDTKIKELIPYVQKMSANASDPENISLINTIEDLQNAHPNEAKAYAIYGDVLMNVGKTNEAIEKYAKTLTLNKSNYAVWEQYMYALESESRYEELVTVSNDALDLYPNQAMCYYFNGAGHLKTGNKKESDSMFEEALLIGRRNETLKQRIESLQAGGIIENQKDNFKQWAFMRNYRAPYNSKIFEEFGDALMKEGDQETALEYWEKALKGTTNKLRLEEKISSIKAK